MKSHLFSTIIAVTMISTGPVSAAPVIYDLASASTSFEVAGSSANQELAGTGNGVSRSIITGDLNADGINDLVVASPKVTTYGAVQIVFGRAEWPESPALMGSLADVTISGSLGQKLANAVACGDVNGDGITDLVIGGSSMNNSPLTSSGKVLVFFGRSSWPASLGVTDADVTLAGSTNSGQFGHAVCVDDFDGDTLADIAVMAAFDTFTIDTTTYSNYGSVYCYEGRSSWPTSLGDADARTAIRGVSASGFTPGQLWSGDCDDDGKADLFIGSANVKVTGVIVGSSKKTGAVWGLPGRAAADWPASIQLTYVATAEVPFFIHGNVTHYEAGTRGACGDIDGDGRDDLVITATPTYTGLYAFFGKATFWDLTTNTLIHEARDRYMGSSQVSSLQYVLNTLAIGDVDGDGLEDIITGFGTANVSGRNQGGLVALRYGRSSWPTTAEDDDVQYYGRAASDNLGMMVACGDITGDGVGEMFFNAPGFDRTGYSNCGKIYMVTGSRTTPEVTVSLIGSTVRVSVSSRSGRTCLLESSSNLSAWDPVSTWNTDGTDSTFDLSASTSGFYRVVVNP